MKRRSPNLQLPLFHYTEIQDNPTSPEPSEEVSTTEKDLGDTSQHDSNDIGIQVDMDLMVEVDLDPEETPLASPFSVDLQAPEFTFNNVSPCPPEQSLSVLELQNQTDQLQSIILHISDELGRLRGLVQDIAERATTPNPGQPQFK